MMEFPSYPAAEGYAASLLGNKTLPAMSDMSVEFYEEALDDHPGDFFTARPFRSVAPAP